MAAFVATWRAYAVGVGLGAIIEYGTSFMAERRQ
jgi:hypothetical protein